MRALHASPVVLLMGATATGKTGLALALAEKLDAEIISVDSAQVYRGMDIGTAKPDAAQRARVPHHLLDVVDPAEIYSAARFAQDATKLITQIRARGRVPLLVGGTLLYFRALTRGLSALPSADAALRARLAQEAEQLGWPALHARLAQRDPATAARLHPNDHQRIQRALEIIELTGQTSSTFHAQPKSAADLGAAVRIALELPDRSVLHARIAQRFAQMMRGGFLEEVRALHARGDLHTALPSVRAVGYRQLWEHLEGRATLDLAVERGIAATRQLAKRQLTWLRSETGIARLDANAPDVVAQALNLVEMAWS